MNEIEVYFENGRRGYCENNESAFNEIEARFGSKIVETYKTGGEVLTNVEKMRYDLKKEQSEFQKKGEYAILLQFSYDMADKDLSNKIKNKRAELENEITKKLGYYVFDNYSFVSGNSDMLMFDANGNPLGLLEFDIRTKYENSRFTPNPRIFNETYGDVFYIDYIFSFGKGNGQKMMKEIKKYADKYNVSIGLEGSVIEKDESGELMASAEHLERFYTKQGFQNTHGHYFIYQPKKTFDGNNPDIRYKTGGKPGETKKKTFIGVPEIPGYAWHWYEQKSQYDNSKPTIIKYEDRNKPLPKKTKKVIRDEGIDYFKGAIGKDKWVDALLYKNKYGEIIGILNHYPFNFEPYEKKGNINVMVAPQEQGKGIGLKLIKEALKRYPDIDLYQQQWTPQGQSLLKQIGADKNYYKFFQEYQNEQKKVSKK